MERTLSRRSILAGVGGAAFAGPALALNACGQSGAPAAQTSTAPATIEFSFWGDPKLVDTFQKDIADFNKVTPAIQVKTNHMPTDYYTKLETLIVGGTPPDL